MTEVLTELELERPVGMAVDCYDCHYWLLSLNIWNPGPPTPSADATLATTQRTDHWKSPLAKKKITTFCLSPQNLAAFLIELCDTSGVTKCDGQHFSCKGDMLLLIRYHAAPRARSGH